MDCKNCIHNGDQYFCGSCCMYGDCFESKDECDAIKITEDMHPKLYDAVAKW